MKLSGLEMMMIREVVEQIVDNHMNEEREVMWDIENYIDKLEEEVVPQEPFDDTVYFTEREML